MLARFESAPLTDNIVGGELIEGGYLKGTTTYDENGIAADVAVTGMTSQGRLFLQKLRAEKKLSRCSE
jgi:hypothetical protein